MAELTRIIAAAPVARTVTNLHWVRQAKRWRVGGLEDTATAFIFVHFNLYIPTCASRVIYCILCSTGDRSQVLQICDPSLANCRTVWRFSAPVLCCGLIGGEAGKFSGCNWNLHFLPGLSYPSENGPKQQDTSSSLVNVIPIMNKALWLICHWYIFILNPYL